MRNKRQTEAELSKYFKEMAGANKEVPYITEISKATGVSPATISRYARRKGFYNFSDMRVSFNKGMSISDIPSHEYKAFLEVLKFDKVNIITSNSTKIIGDFLKMRLDFLGTKVQLIEPDHKWNSDEFTYFITISNDSMIIENAIKKAKGRRILITTKKNENLPKTITQIVLSEHSIGLRNHFDVSNAIVNIINSINRAANYVQIKYDNEKNKI